MCPMQVEDSWLSCFSSIGPGEFRQFGAHVFRRCPEAPAEEGTAAATATNLHELGQTLRGLKGL